MSFSCMFRVSSSKFLNTLEFVPFQSEEVRETLKAVEQDKEARQDRLIEELVGVKERYVSYSH